MVDNKDLLPSNIIDIIKKIKNEENNKLSYPSDIKNLILPSDNKNLNNYLQEHYPNNQEIHMNTINTPNNNYLQDHYPNNQEIHMNTINMPNNNYLQEQYHSNIILPPNKQENHINNNNIPTNYKQINKQPLNNIYKNGIKCSYKCDSNCMNTSPHLHYK